MAAEQESFESAVDEQGGAGADGDFLDDTAEGLALDDSQDAAVVEEEEEEDEPETREVMVDAKYHLHGVVCHSGPSSSSGHYTSDILDESTGYWSRHDDSLVTTLSQLPAEWSRNGYLLIYCHASCFR